MFRKIMVPVDLTHADSLSGALRVAGELAKLYGASLCFVGVTAPQPSEVAHTPEEYRRKLAAFAEKQGAGQGVSADSHAMVRPDPATELNDALLDAVKETGSDLVVMGTHIPALADALWASHGGALASHARVSVMLVR